MPERQPGRVVHLPVSAPTAAPSDPAPNVEPELGQIRLAQPARGSSVTVLIIELHDAYVQVLLCGDDYALATETDAVLEPRQSGCPGRLLVHGDVSAAVMKTRLSQVLGAATPELVERIVLRGLGRDFDSRDLGRGTPILAHDDPRWEWKLEQLKRVRGVRAHAGEIGWTLPKLSAGTDPAA